jgi:hypothetical protein
MHRCETLGVSHDSANLALTAKPHLRNKTKAPGRRFVAGKNGLVL